MSRERFGPDDLDQLAPSWDAAVALTQGADPFCAASDWSFAAATSFTHASAPVVVAAGEGLCGLRSVVQPDGSRMLVGLDPVWGFATPAVGPPTDAADALVEQLGIHDWDYALIAGQDVEFPGTHAIVHALGDFRVLRGPNQERLRADLSGGFDAWWARRSSRFRQRLRRIEREASEAGIDVVDGSTGSADDILERILRIEAASWKAGDDTGLNTPDMAAFYRAIARRLAPEGRLRALFAREADNDIGYVLGGVRGPIYRGLQLSYVASAADRSIGHLLQLAQLRRLGPTIECYDLGMDMPYKRRWVDTVEPSLVLVVQR